MRTRLHAAYSAWKAPAASPRRVNPRRRAARPPGPGKAGRGGRPVRTGATVTPVQVHFRLDWRQSLPAAVAAIASIASMAFVGAGLYVTNDANRVQQRITERGQITDRFGKAVEQLGQEGADKLGIRLGGVYALESIMRDSAADEPMIIEILCAFVRTHVAAPEVGGWWGDSRPVSTPDVQAAFTVLARRPDGDSPANRRVDLGDTLISHQYGQLAAARLRGVSLSAADLSGADLSGAVLADAYLGASRLSYADLSAADLSNAYLGQGSKGVRVPDVKWGDFQGNVQLQGATLSRANLTGAIVRSADLRGAHLDGARLVHADLSEADLFRADLNGADLTSANLFHADLSSATLNRTRLTGADLGNANLSGVDLSTAVGLTGDHLRCVTVDENTKLPPGVVVRMRAASPECL
jgi:uncharacterized protein YjbI with pentapeptide repeats